MAKPGPMPDPDAKRRNTREVLELELPEAGTDVELADVDVVVPDPPRGLDRAHLEAWAELWRSPLALAGAFHDTDLDPLRRLFLLRQRAAEAWSDCDAAPTVEGSMGQDVANPRCAQANQLEQRVLALEDRYGLNSRERVRLIGQQQDNALTAARRRRAEAGTQEGAGADPRIADPRSPSAVRRPEGDPVGGGDALPR